jgi:hypothetical protein
MRLPVCFSWCLFVRAENPQVSPEVARVLLLLFVTGCYRKRLDWGGRLWFHKIQEAKMTEYRLFFLGLDGAIEARHDFAAPDDSAAQQIMTVLAEASSDSHHGVMLWQGTRRIFEKHDGAQPECGTMEVVTMTALAADSQQVVIECEEALLGSHWRLAKSKMLLDATNDMRRELFKPQRTGAS